MINTLFQALWLLKLGFCCFPLARAKIRPWPLVPFFQISLKNFELKTTHSTFRDCRMHFFRQPFSKYLYIFKFISELQQKLRRRLRKRHLKSEFALLQTLSRLFQLVQFVKCWQIFLELNCKRLQSSGKEEESRCFVFTSSTKREIRHFHVVVVQRRQRNVQKSVMHVQSCCFANLNLLLFCRSRCLRRSLS